jgi:hypothetical protein
MDEPAKHLQEMKQADTGLHQGAISPEIKTMVQAEVREQLDRERAILREAGSLALKIVAGAFALLLAIFTVFGLTTWNDVAKQTTDYMKQRVDALIQSRDSDTGVQQTLNDLVNRAIIASELSDRSGEPHDLPKFEWDRLRAWLKSENLELQEFQDALAVLNAQSPERKKADANSFLSEMLNPPDKSNYQWITRQPEKRLAIITNFYNADLGASAVAIATSSVSEDLRLAAIRDVNYTYGFDKLITMASGEDDGPLKTEAFLTSAKLRPTNRLFLAALTKLMSDTNSRSVSTAVKIVLQWWEERSRRSGQGDVETEKRVLASSKELLEFAFRGGVNIQLASAANVSESDGRMKVQFSKSPYFFWKLPANIGATDLASQSPEEFEQLKPYWELLNDAANAADSKKVAEYMFLGDPILTAAIHLGENSRIVYKSRGGDQIVLTDPSDEISLLPKFQSSDGDLWLNWSNNNNGKAGDGGTILSFSGQHFTFTLNTDSTGRQGTHN